MAFRRTTRDSDFNDMRRLVRKLEQYDIAGVASACGYRSTDTGDSLEEPHRFPAFPEGPAGTYPARRGGEPAALV